MDKNKALKVLSKVIDFWLQENSKDTDHELFRSICDAELYIKDNLINGEFNHGLDIKMLIDIKVDGELVAQWPINVDSTGSDFLYYHNGDYYLIQIDDDIPIKGERVNVEELELNNGSPVLDYIVNHRVELRNRLETIESEDE